MIIFGTKGRITNCKSNYDLTNTCPKCGNDLNLSELKKWFTLYFIPVFPYSYVDTFYYCKNCESPYKEEAYAHLMGGKKSQDKLHLEMKQLFGETLIACLSYMAIVDGKIDKEEEKLMKSFMFICGLFEDLYETVLEKVK